MEYGLRKVINKLLVFEVKIEIDVEIENFLTRITLIFNNL